MSCGFVANYDNLDTTRWDKSISKWHKIGSRVKITEFFCSLVCLEDIRSKAVLISFSVQRLQYFLPSP